MRTEMANLTEVSANAQKELRGVKRMLSGVWHQYDASSLEALKFIGEMSVEDKKDFLAALKQIDRISKAGEENLVAKSNLEVSPVGNSPADFSGLPPTSEPTPEPTSESTPEPKFREYKVKPGDSISRIARKHAVTSEAIAEASGLKDVNRIRVGQVLKIPTK
jgi:LysM repeat protein